VNSERVLNTLREYRATNRSFDRLISAVLANPRGKEAVERAVDAARAASHRRSLRRPGSQRSYTRAFFIAGEMRSGTSWLRRMLNVHPEIACGHEGSFFGRDYDREEIPVYTGPVSSLTRAIADSKSLKVWHELPWNQWTDGYDEDLTGLARVMVDYFLSKEAARTGKPIVGDKSPQHTHNLDEIHEIYPDARIVHIVRDGRDVAVSAMNHWWRQAQDRDDPVFELDPEELDKRDAYLADREGFLSAGESIFTEKRLRQIAERWAYRVGKARRDGVTIYSENYLELRYEDLLADVPANIRRVLDGLGASSGDAMVERCARAGNFESVSNRKQGEEDSSSFFRKGVVGDWRSVFNKRDRQLFDEVAGERLEEVGYRRSTDTRAGRAS
jgi:hypothetical protein